MRACTSVRHNSVDCAREPRWPTALWCEPCKERFSVRGDFERLATGETYSRTVYACEDTSTGGTVFKLRGGSTGFESFYVSDLASQEGEPERLFTEGWTACGGTKGSWDKLHITGDQMRKAFDALWPKEEK